MNGTRRRPAGPILLVALLIVALATVVVGALGGHRTASATAPPTTDEPPVTANPFLPEDQNVSDCIGAVERPGCGSEERGGWHQTLVFAVIGVGLAFIFTMIVREVRRSRRVQEAAHHDP